MTQHWLHLEYNHHSHLHNRFTRKLNKILKAQSSSLHILHNDSYEDSKGGRDDLKDVYIFLNVGGISELTIGSDKLVL